jgi:allose kinase
MAGFPKERLVERILVHTRKPFPAQSLRVIFTGDEEDKCVIGAAEYAAMRMKRMN